jgi:hypothetical protein
MGSEPTGVATHACGSLPALSADFETDINRSQICNRWTGIAFRAHISSRLPSSFTSTVAQSARTYPCIESEYKTHTGKSLTFNLSLIKVRLNLFLQLLIGSSIERHSVLHRVFDFRNAFFLRPANVFDYRNIGDRVPPGSERWWKRPYPRPSQLIVIGCHVCGTAIATFASNAVVVNPHSCQCGQPHAGIERGVPQFGRFKVR